MLLIKTGHKSDFNGNTYECVTIEIDGEEVYKKSVPAEAVQGHTDFIIKIEGDALSIQEGDGDGYLQEYLVRRTYLSSQDIERKIKERKEKIS